eukprot:TRINITY_DN5536_c0_g1_i1.p1 TRINITY_DN5536_c0_g1~~TRINITY_DN5536_c0_g1_i1.p1  ORF type:complete len:838 (-),score=182.97 TRINITY_DN5536_c0_g1_i1:158-2671(-)
MNVKLVGIGAEDIFEGQRKLILGLIWSLFRTLRMTDLTGSTEGQSTNKKAMEEGLLTWVREQTKGYPGVNVTDFKHGFGDGLALAALVHKYKSDLVDYDALPKDDSAESKQENVEMAFSLAEKHMNIPKLLDANDLIAGDPDERSVQLYVSMFFHAFALKAEKERIKREKEGITAEMDNLASNLAREEEERRRLIQEKEALEAGQAAMASDLAAKSQQAAELEAAKARLEREVEELRGKVEGMEQLQERERELREKTEALEELVEHETEAKEESLNELAALRDELDSKRKENQSLHAQLSQGGETQHRVQEERDTLASNLDQLKQDLRRETETRVARERVNARLKQENEELRRLAQGAGEQRTGWDLLQRNLEEHLEDLYCWHEVLNADSGDETGKRIDLKPQIRGLVAGQDFSQAFNTLNSRLEEENATLLRILSIKDTQNLRREVVDKSGWLQQQGLRDATSWKRRWFILRGNTLSYYLSESNTEESKGSINIASCSVQPESPLDGDKDRQHLLSVSVEGRKLVLAAETQRERDRWLHAIRGSLSNIQYRQAADSAKSRPDMRLLQFFTNDHSPSLHLDDRALTSESVQSLAQVLPRREELRTISFNSAHLRDSDVELLVTAVVGLPSLHVLHLNKNKVTVKSVSALARLLEKNSAVRELYIADNELGDDGLSQLAKAVASSKGLRILDISGNNIGDAGIAALVAAIPAEHKLETLRIARNSISDEGAAALAGLLKASTRLSSLNLQGNNISDKGVSALVAALSSNSSLSELDLSSNNIGNQGALQIRQLLQNNKALEGINLSLNKIHGGQDLAAFLESDAFFFPNLSFSRRIGK